MTDLPLGWEWTTLGEVAEVRLGRQRSPKDHAGDSMRPYLRAANVGWDGIKLDDVKHMNFAGAELLTYRLRQGDILVTEASGSPSEVGKPAVWNNELPECYFQNTLIRVRSSVDGLGPYLYCFLLHAALAGVWARGSRGVGINHIGSQRLTSYPIPIPPIAEQRRIVEIVETLTTSINNANHALAFAAQRVVASRSSAIKKVLYGDSKNHDAATEHGLTEGPTDDSGLPRIPLSWTWRRLGEIAEVVGGVTKDSSKQSDPAMPLIPYLRVANVQRGSLDLEDVTSIRATPRQVDKLRLRAGDVMLNEGGDRDKLGRGWIWEGQIENCIHQNHVFRARIREEVLDPKLLAWHANNLGWWFERNGKQSVNLASISLSTIKQLPVPLPPRREQSDMVVAIEGHLDELDRIGRIITETCRQSDRLRLAIAASAVTGALTPQDPSDEPAAVLLEQIRAERADGAISRRKSRPPRRHAG